MFCLQGRLWFHELWFVFCKLWFCLFFCRKGSRWFPASSEYSWLPFHPFPLPWWLCCALIRKLLVLSWQWWNWRDLLIYWFLWFWEKLCFSCCWENSSQENKCDCLEFEVREANNKQIKRFEVREAINKQIKRFVAVTAKGQEISPRFAETYGKVPTKWKTVFGVF